MNSEIKLAIIGAIFIIVGSISYKVYKQKQKDKSKILWYPILFISLGAFMCGFSIFGESSEDYYKRRENEKNGIQSGSANIENEQSIKEQIQGQWSTNFYEMGTTWYYRFEISNNEIKYWTKFGEWEWKPEPEKIHTYTISSIRTDTYGHKFRSLDFEGEDLGLRRGNYLTFDNGCLQFNGSCLEKGWE